MSCCPPSDLRTGAVVVPSSVSVVVGPSDGPSVGPTPVTSLGRPRTGWRPGVVSGTGGPSRVGPPPHGPAPDRPRPVRGLGVGGRGGGPVTSVGVRVIMETQPVTPLVRGTGSVRPGGLDVRLNVTRSIASRVVGPKSWRSLGVVGVPESRVTPVETPSGREPPIRLDLVSGEG